MLKPIEVLPKLSCVSTETQDFNFEIPVFLIGYPVLTAAFSASPDFS